MWSVGKNIANFWGCQKGLVRWLHFELHWLEQQCVQAFFKMFVLYCDFNFDLICWGKFIDRYSHLRLFEISKFFRDMNLCSEHRFLFSDSSKKRTWAMRSSKRSRLVGEKDMNNEVRKRISEPGWEGSRRITHVQRAECPNVRISCRSWGCNCSPCVFITICNFICLIMSFY